MYQFVVDEKFVCIIVVGIGVVFVLFFYVIFGIVGLWIVFYGIVYFIYLCVIVFGDGDSGQFFWFVFDIVDNGYCWFYWYVVYYDCFECLILFDVGGYFVVNGCNCWNVFVGWILYGIGCCIVKFVGFVGDGGVYWLVDMDCVDVV